MASPSTPSTPSPFQEAPDDNTDTSPLSDAPSNIFPPSPLLTKKRPKQLSPCPVPEGYRINSQFGTLMVDPKSRDSVANFRKMYHPDVDFSSGQYIDERAYAPSLRHVPPNVPKKDSPWAAPLGPATKEDVDRYRGPKAVLRQVWDAFKEEDEEDQDEEAAEAKSQPTPGSKRAYRFHEDESWAPSLAKTPMGKKGKKAAVEVVDVKGENEGDTTLTDPAMPATPPVKDFRIR